ncbi:MAG: hypothetical protein IPO83_09830 [Chitinophagaceae bacterium]|nr:hypothetical protein [Chitinophagaceae bacterium]
MSKKKFSFGGIILNWFGARLDHFVLWMSATTFAWAIAIFISLKKRMRMSHNNGIAGTGKVRIVDHPQFPPHDFFQAGKEFPARIRHAMVSFMDDAMNDVFGCSIKFSDNHWDSPFDLECNSGQISLFWSAVSFLKFASLRKVQWGVQYQELYRKYPMCYKGAVITLRRDVSSYENIHYYSKTPFYFIGKDGITRYAKYKVTPYSGEPETGLYGDPSEWDIANARILPHETRGRNFLKDEYAERVKTQGAKYLMQIQLRTASDDEPAEVFNNMLPWDEAVYPWQDLAVVAIDATLDWNESLRTTFSLNNMPKSLGRIPAKSIYDYNSVNYMRAHSEIARKARLWSYKIKGFPPPIPDDDDRNGTEWSKKV